ncbi:MAG: D-alanyl-D-alanine carboxypeptidase [Clostridium sp.]|nr:D-alanyl-D-alanine carboxypeptidase [Clostridium sp.]
MFRKQGAGIKEEWIRRGTAAAVLTAGLFVLLLHALRAQSAQNDGGADSLFAEAPRRQQYHTAETLHEKTSEQLSLSLYARAALLLDADNNRVLYENNGMQVMAMASTTKIMTCILALEYGNPDDLVTVSARAAAMPKVKCYLRAGEQYRLGDLLYSMMLQSHNDTAAAIAEHIGGSIEGFAELMNRKAIDLGCTDTLFITPNGLDAAKEDGSFHSTTAYDLARIAAYAVQNEEFLRIVGTRSYSFSSADGTRSFTVSNADRFLDMMDGAIGIKTGFTGQAGYCFVGALKRDGKTFVSVVLGCGWPPNKNYKWHDTKALMEHGAADYAYEEIPVRDNAPAVTVLNGKEKRVSAVVSPEPFGLLLSACDEVVYEREMNTALTAPVEAGAIAGYDRYYVNGTLYRVFPIYTGGAVGRIDYPFCLEHVWDRLLL